MIKAITKENKDEWIKWTKEQLDTTNNASYKQTGINRVFLTEKDDIDIAKYLLETLLKTAEEIK